MKKLLFLLALASTCHAAGPKYNFDDSKLTDEFVNVYKDIGTVLKGDVRITSATISNLTVTTITAVQITNWASYTPTFQSFGTTTNVNMYWKRIGDLLFIQGSFTAGVLTAVAPRIGLPGTVVISNAPVHQLCGTLAIQATGGGTSVYSVLGINTHGYFELSRFGSAGTDPLTPYTDMTSSGTNGVKYSIFAFVSATGF